jgi:hypothetical protein
MSCKDFQEQISSFIQRECDGEKRILIKNHLKICDECREMYLSQVKLFYIVDREEILAPLPDASMAFNQEVLERIDLTPEKKNYISTRLIWYSAAAILIIGITIGRFVIPDNSGQKFISQNGDQTLGQLIASEDWGKLEIVLSDEDEFNKYATDAIPIHILLEKLSTLQKMGVESLPIADKSDHNKYRETATLQNDPQIQISLNDFIRILEQVKLQRSRITLEEVSNLLTKI